MGRTDDNARFCGVKRQLYYQIRTGRRPITDNVAATLSQKTGVPAHLIKSFSPSEFADFIDRQTTLGKDAESVKSAQEIFAELIALTNKFKKFV